MNMHEHRRKRLIALLQDRYQNNRRQFCDESNLSESRLGQLLSPTYRGGQGFGEKAARRLEKRLGLNPLYFELLMIGETSAHLAYRGQASSGENVDDIIFIRQVSLIPKEGSSHPDIAEVKQADAVLSLHRNWLNGHDLIPEHLIAIAIEDAGMAPRLATGDIVVIDTASTEPIDNGIFLLNVNGTVSVRRLILDLGQWYISADNPNRKHYQRQSFDANESEILGRVVFHAGAFI